MNSKLMMAFVLSLVVLVAAPAARADDGLSLSERLDVALEDEYHARSVYAAVLEQFGEARPFSNIIRAEQRHIDALLVLYDSHGLAAPGDPYADAEFEFASVEEAARLALEAEIANADLYDELLEGLAEPDVVRVFEQLQWASRERHLPALERFVDGECPAGGCGRRAARRGRNTN